MGLSWFVVRVAFESTACFLVLPPNIHFMKENGLPILSPCWDDFKNILFLRGRAFKVYA